MEIPSPNRKRDLSKMIKSFLNDAFNQVKTQAQVIAEKIQTPSRIQSVLRFPQDLDTAGHGNVIRFNINVPSGSKYIGSAYGNAAGVDPATGQPATPRYMESTSNSLARRFSGNSVRIDTTIDLYMPPKIDATYSSRWNMTELGVTGTMTDALKGLTNIESWEDGGRAWDVVKQSVPEVAKNTIAGMTQALTPLNTKDLKALVTNTVSNPYMEVLFEGIDNRTFSFTFKMIPRNEQEQRTIQEIVKQFKFHRAPEVKYSGNNQYWIFPSTFDITFIHKNRENPHLFKISTCALTSFNVDHSPEGQYSAHADGSPFATTITLEFTEMEALHKGRIAEGY